MNEPVKMLERYPFNGTFELTVRCNLQCKMCMLRQEERESGRLLSKELSTQQWIELARQVADA